MGRFLFDECVGKPVMESIRHFVQSEAQFTHICDYLSQGVLDAEWVPRIAAEGGWVVITADGGRQSKRGHKLPDICRAYGVTHVILSAKLHAKKSDDKAKAIAAVWGLIERLVEEPGGSRYRLRYKDTKSGLAVALEKVDPPPLAPPSSGDAADPPSPPEQEP